MPNEVFDTHVVWDPGARELAARVALALDAPIVLGKYTRLVADLNRSPTNAAAIPVHAFGVDVPGNAALAEAERAERLERFHRPYWTEVFGDIERALRSSEVVVHLSMHSFTPVYRGVTRDLDVGVLFDPGRELDRRFAELCLSTLRARGLAALANEPYHGLDDGIATALRAVHPEDRFVAVEIELSHRTFPLGAALESPLTIAVADALIEVARSGAWAA